jgi:long-chain fatty acid transport protein
MPKRGTTAALAGNQTIDSDSNSFLIPEFGYNKQLDDKSSYGVSVYGNGGMNTDYAKNPVRGGAAEKMGVDLMQLVVAPTWAYKLDSSSSVGISPLLTFQQIKVDGISHFGPMSLNSNALSNKGRDSSQGLGVRLGYFKNMTAGLSVGASYSPKTKMSKFDDYAGLFNSSFDIPENYTLGLSYKAAPAWRVAADYQRINYGSVSAIGNSTRNLLSCQSAPVNCLGGANGPGFGWGNVDVVKLGVEWQYSSALVLRAGYNQTTNPVKAEDVTFNIMAPGVVTKHYTLGGTYELTKDTQVTASYMYAPENSVTGNGLFNGVPGYTQIGDTDKIRMSQQSLGIQFGWKF